MYLCVTCGTEYPGKAEPAHCTICEDERQYVGFDGQKWTTLAHLQRTHHNTFVELESHLSTFFTEPKFAIGQRAFLLESTEGNILWDCLSLLDESTVEFIQSRGGLSAIAVSHPHYYANMVEWSRAFRDVPIYIHADDRQWVMRQDDCIQFWSGEILELHDRITLVRCGGHFAGGTVLHWPDGAGGHGALLSGDIIQVVPDRRWVSFMYSYPNLIPLDAAAVHRLETALEPFDFERIYGAFHPLQVERDGKGALRRSVQRYLRAIGAPAHAR